VQTEIATQLGVSTTPVREAMRDLASKGLIVLDSHRIGTVRKPDWNEMVEIGEMRLALEAIAMGHAMENMTGADLGVARGLAKELSRENDVGSWVEKNIRFHSVFHNATKTSRLSGVLIALEEAGGIFVAQAQRLHPEIRKRALADHLALLDAFEAQDLERAIEIQRSHISLPLEAYDLDSR
jgi:DNA-binding GntR family transcriptional regulator